VSVWAVVAAAGEGRRLGLNRPKAFAPLGSRVLLAESLERLEATGWVDGVVVAVPAGWEEPTILLAEELGLGKVTAVVPGGDTRAGSVRAALAEVPQEAAVIMVHDAARPLLSESVVGRVLTALNDGWDGAVPGIVPADTVKRVARGGVEETLPRERVRLVQTPQAFVAAVLRDALAGGEDASDCAAMVEARGGRVAVVEGDRRLLKITDGEDLALVSTWLGVSPPLPIEEDDLDEDEDEDIDDEAEG
jgi:2-C-methyl-D-erythritol 4-phosphate cytidylyltransferase